MLASTDTVSITFEEQQEQPTDSCLGNEKTPNALHLHHILPISTRRQIARWVGDSVFKSGETLLVSETVEQFPYFFKGSGSANHMRARRLWRDRESYHDVSNTSKLARQSTFLTHVTKFGLQHTLLNAQVGRGGKRAARVDALHVGSRAEFDRLRKL